MTTMPTTTTMDNGYPWIFTAVAHDDDDDISHSAHGGDDDTGNDDDTEQSLLVRHGYESYTVTCWRKIPKSRSLTK